MEWTDFDENNTHLDSHHDVFKVLDRTCSAHQSNVLLRQWLPPLLRFQIKTVPIILCIKISSPAMHVTECKGLLNTPSRASVPQHTKLLLFTCSRTPKFASSLNQTTSWKSESSLNLFSKHQHITKLHFISAGVSTCLIWILYEYSWMSFFKILCNDLSERPSSLVRL